MAASAPTSARATARRPPALLPLRTVLYRPDRLPAPVCAVPVQPLTPHDGWCDDPAHPAYNRPVRLPINASAEALWRDDAVYDIIGVLGWNDDPVQPGRGSAIFLHVARAISPRPRAASRLRRTICGRCWRMGLTEILGYGMNRSRLSPGSATPAGRPRTPGRRPSSRPVRSRTSSRKSR